MRVRNVISAMALGAIWGQSPCAAVMAQQFTLPHDMAVNASTPRSQGTLPDDIDERLQRMIAGLWPEAQRRGVFRPLFDRAMAGLAPDADVLSRLTAQPELESPPWDYLARLVTSQRIEAGRRNLALHADTLAEVERRSGVDRHVTVAIWGVESGYGASTGTRSVIRSLATLAAADPRRSDFWRGELLGALSILQRGDTTLERLTGSWAGAMGHTQFMPSSYLAHGTDFDGDGRRDIWESIPDALASTANYLRAVGWKPHEPWGFEVSLPPGFDLAAVGDDSKKPMLDWLALGVSAPAGRTLPAVGLPLRLILPAGVRGPVFLVTGNFQAILRYNNALAYALAVSHLADRLRGGEAIAAAWPSDDPPLDRAQRSELQRLLIQLGFNTGGIDGIVGTQTRAAIRLLQSRIGLPPDGYASANLLAKVRHLASP